MSQYLTGLNLIDPGVKRYDGGTSSFTMDANGTTNGTLLWVDGVAQVPGTDYNVSAATITTTTAAGAGTNNVVSLQLFSTGILNAPADNTAATATIQDNAVTLAKMAGGTDGNIISFDASGDPVYIATGNDGQVLTSAGAGQPPAFEAAGGPTSGTMVATTSGSNVTFSGIPSGVSRIQLGFDQQSADGNHMMYLTLGDSGGLETSGYTMGSTAAPVVTSAISMYMENAGYTHSGIIHIMRLDSSTNLWMAMSHGWRYGTQVHTTWGRKALSGELTQLDCAASAGSFDAGNLNIIYD